MREETAGKILANLRKPENERLPMTVPQQRLMEEVKTCLGLLDEDLLIAKPKLRDKLVETLGCSASHAYELIWLAFEAIGSRNPTAKNVVREQILQMAREMHEVANTQEGTEKVETLSKAGNMLARAFATNVDEGEVLDAAKYLEIDKVVIVSDPESIGIHITEEDRKEIERLKQQDGIVDADFEEIEEKSE